MGAQEPYNKPNYNLLYINTNSNHPPNIIKNLQGNIQKRVKKLSRNTNIFNKSKDLYNNILSASRFQQKIKFEQSKTPAAPNKNRKKNIIWFNAP